MLEQAGRDERRARRPAPPLRRPQAAARLRRLRRTSARHDAVPLGHRVELPTAADTEALGDAARRRARRRATWWCSPGRWAPARPCSCRGIGPGPRRDRAPSRRRRSSSPASTGRGRDGGRPLVHVDAYRLGGPAELDDLDLDTDLDEAVVVVEWGEGVAERLAERARARPPRPPARRRAGTAARSRAPDLAGVELVASQLCSSSPSTPPRPPSPQASCELTADGCVAALGRGRRTTPARTPSCSRPASSRALRRGRGRARRPRPRSSPASGPGPFTGLRVGMVTAAALGDALGIPVYGVCSLDAHRARARRAGRSSSPTPAAARSTGRPTTPTASAPHGPHVDAPAALADAAPRRARGGRRATPRSPACPWSARPRRPRAGLVAVAADAMRAGVAAEPLEPLYLRRPDAGNPVPASR